MGKSGNAKMGKLGKLGELGELGELKIDEIEIGNMVKCENVKTRKCGNGEMGKWGNGELIRVECHRMDFFFGPVLWGEANSLTVLPYLKSIIQG